MIMNKKNNVLLIILSAVSLILFFYFTEFFGVELREISAITADTILKLAGLAVQRHKTILKLGKLSFDIIPACNGSTTLQVLFTSALFLVLLNNKLDYKKKIICLFLTVPIALLANGIRLALLVYCSHIKNHVLADGLLHNLIGILGFLIALSTFLIVFELLSKNHEESSHQENLKRELFITALVFSFIALLPFFSACLRDWIGTEYNRNDMLGFLFFIPGLFCYCFLWKYSPPNKNSLKIGSVIFATVLLLGCAFQIVSKNNYILGMVFFSYFVYDGFNGKRYKIRFSYSSLFVHDDKRFFKSL